MTTPAASPQEPAKRSKRIYVLWGVALAVLLLLGTPVAGFMLLRPPAVEMKNATDAPLKDVQLTVWFNGENKTISRNLLPGEKDRTRFSTSDLSLVRIEYKCTESGKVMRTRLEGLATPMETLIVTIGPGTEVRVDRRMLCGEPIRFPQSPTPSGAGE